MDMSCKIKSELGIIKITKPTIGQAVVGAIGPLHTMVQIVNKKGHGMGQWGEAYRPNMASLVEIITDVDGLAINLHIITKFGTSIKETTDTMSKLIRQNLKNMFGLEVDYLTFTIVGVKSKEVARRNLIIRG